MNRVLMFTSAILLMIGAIAVGQSAAQDDTSTSGAADEQSAEEQFAAIEADYNKAMKEFSAAYREAVNEARKIEDRAEAQRGLHRKRREVPRRARWPLRRGGCLRPG